MGNGQTRLSSMLKLAKMDQMEDNCIAQENVDSKQNSDTKFRLTKKGVRLISCAICSKEAQEKDYKRHLKKHKTPYATASSKIIKKRNLNNEIQSSDTNFRLTKKGVKFIPCAICLIEVQEEHYERHLKKHKTPYATASSKIIKNRNLKNEILPHTTTSERIFELERKVDFLMMEKNTDVLVNEITKEIDDYNNLKKKCIMMFLNDVEKEKATHFMCKICNKYFRTKALLKNHKIKKHSSSIACGDVDDNPNCSAAIKHHECILNHKNMSEQIFQCKVGLERKRRRKKKSMTYMYCKKSGTEKCDKDKCKKNIFKEKRFKCNICLKEYGIENKLEKHIKKRHSTSQDSGVYVYKQHDHSDSIEIIGQKNDKTVIPDLISPKKEPGRASLTVQSFNKISKFEQKNENRTCTEQSIVKKKSKCSERYDKKQSLQTSILSPTDRPFSRYCKYCGQKFTVKDEYKKHKSWHQTA